jgi:predicted alpha/beta-fold hydrolase
MLKLRLVKIKKNSFNKLKRYFAPETLRKIRQVKIDYLRLLKGILLVSGTSLICFLLHRQISYFNTYEVVYVENDKNKYIANKLLPVDYKPTFYIPNCFSQMVYNEIKAKPEIEYKREYVNTHDGGVISFDWVVKSDAKEDIKSDKLLVVLHGLTGGSESSYIKEILEEYNKLPGFKIVAINYRGVSGSPLLTPSIYHAGYTEDLRTALSYLQSHYPNHRCYAIGTSMGANIFTKLLANHQEFNSYIKGFISISNPFNCHEVEKRNRGGILDMFLRKRQIAYIETHKEILKSVIGK